jgi:Zn-finger nucleic acid-binding protein
MLCPRDKTTLEPFDLHGISVDRCPECAGLWLDCAELDELEDAVFDADEFKGTLVFSDQTTSLLCPICQKPLRAFKYRLNDLVLEHCPELHGFWLDADEEHRIHELLQERSKDLAAKAEAERDWANTLRRLRSPTLAQKLRDLFR